MKKKFVILVLIGITFSYSLKAQQYNDTLKNDILTPNGNPVVTWAMEEDTWDVREGFDNLYTRAYPNAKPIITYDNLSSTRRFNCHGYAWLTEEGGPDRWIGRDFTEVGLYPDIYMSDNSYIEVSSGTHPAKVFWERPKDHSAITTSHPDTVISKWNKWPLMKHYWSDNPFGSGNLKYYIRCPTPVVNFTNQIVTTNTTITSCGDINVQNVKVTNGAKLILDAAGEVNIISDFDVDLGSEFEIR